MATRIVSRRGVEPRTSGMSSRRSAAELAGQDALLFRRSSAAPSCANWSLCPAVDLNHAPSRCGRDALPNELARHWAGEHGAPASPRTALSVSGRVVCQLMESNHPPSPLHGDALPDELSWLFNVLSATPSVVVTFLIKDTHPHSIRQFGALPTELRRRVV